MQYSAVQYSIYSRSQSSAKQYSTIELSKLQYNTVQYSSVNCNMIQAEAEFNRVGVMALGPRANHHKDSHGNHIKAF